MSATLFTSVQPFLARYWHPLHAARPALLAVDYGTKKIGFAEAAGLAGPVTPAGVVRPPMGVGEGASPPTAAGAAALRS